MLTNYTIKLNGTSINFKAITKTPIVGYEDVFKSYTMISGKRRRVYEGKRFVARISYDWLTNEETSVLDGLLSAQRTSGVLTAEITTPFSTFTGDVSLDINSDQKRFMYSAVLGQAVWTNWTITLTGVDICL